MHYRVEYEPAESDSGLFGGNSNWRGPIWMPVNYLLIENLRRFHQFYGDRLTIECPTGSGIRLTLDQIADELCRRLLKLFQRRADGRRPVFGGYEKFQTDPHFKDYILFHEYFHGDNGRGCGAFPPDGLDRTHRQPHRPTRRGRTNGRRPPSGHRADQTKLAFALTAACLKQQEAEEQRRFPSTIRPPQAANGGATADAYRAGSPAPASELLPSAHGINFRPDFGYPPALDAKDIDPRPGRRAP
jgi:hypothetical protein